MCRPISLRFQMNTLKLLVLSAIVALPLCAGTASAASSAESNSQAGASAGASAGAISGSGASSAGNSQATGGKGGDSHSASSTGASTATAGASQSGVYIDQSSQGNNYSSPKQPVWGAAPLMLNGCQDGLSAQGQSAGVASAFESATCTKLRMAETYQKLAIYYEAKGDKKQAEMYNKLLGKAVADAGDASDFQHGPKIVGGTASALIPMGALIWLFTLI